MPEKINGLVHESVSIREGKNWEGNDVLEISFRYSQQENNESRSVAVVSREAARDLAFHLLDLFLYGGENG